MIFVTVGTHEQQFNRLIRHIDNLKKSKDIKDEVFIQTGYSDYVPKFCKWKKILKKKAKNCLTVPLSGVKIHKLSQKTRRQKQKELRKIKALAKIHQKLFCEI